MLGKAYAGQPTHIIWDPTWIEFFTTTGESIRRVARPPAGTDYVGNSQPRGFMANHKPSPMS